MGQKDTLTVQTYRLCVWNACNSVKSRTIWLVGWLFMKLNEPIRNAIRLLSIQPRLAPEAEGLIHYEILGTCGFLGIVVPLYPHSPGLGDVISMVSAVIGSNFLEMATWWTALMAVGNCPERDPIRTPARLPARLGPLNAVGVKLRKLR